MILQNKAWTVNKQIFREPWFAPDITVLAKNRSHARSKAMLELRDDYNNSDGEPITFLNLRISRDPQYDQYLVDGSLKTLLHINQEKDLKEHNDALDRILSENPKGKAFIKKGGYFYRSNKCGYAESKINAGVYSVQDAVNEVRGCSLSDCMSVVLIDPAEHNKMIMDQIEYLKSNMI